MWMARIEVQSRTVFKRFLHNEIVDATTVPATEGVGEWERRGAYADDDTKPIEEWKEGETHEANEYDVESGGAE